MQLMSNVRRLSSMSARISHRLNVPGDFYVEDECCTMCAVPFSEAPNLFGVTAGEDHCFVKKQPTNADELTQMVNAIQCAELKCIRYKGTQRSTQIRLVEVNEGSVCDDLPPDLQEVSDRMERRALARWREVTNEESRSHSWWLQLLRLFRRGA
jgi:hypothetical protein